MELISRVRDGVSQFVGVFSQSAFVCVFLSFVTALASAILIRFLVGALLQMHRSRTNMKKLKKNYVFWQKLLLQPAWKECLHAKIFCRVMIVYHHTRIILLAGILLLVLISNWLPELLCVSGYCAGFVFLLIDIPIWLMRLILDKYPLRRMKHEYRFQKYHNTQNRESLI